jgi:hypothetical protein
MATRLSNVTNGPALPNEWIAMEHYRLHTVEAWPDSPRKNASLAAIHSALAALTQDSNPKTTCNVCSGRNKSRSIVEFPKRSTAPAKPRVAA